jgi:hypothetical protein
MLIKKDLIELFDIYNGELEHHRDLVAKRPLAKHIQRDKLPSVFSESLIAHALMDGFLLEKEGPFIEADVHNKKVADIVLKLDNDRYLKIEAKGTGKNEYISLGDGDYAADYLICMRLVENNCKFIIFKNLDKHLLVKIKKITYPALLKLYFNDVDVKYFTIQTLLGM